MGQITVFSGPERRRRWSDEERLDILREAFAPGARVAEVCRRHDISSALIYTWRRKLREAHAEPAPEDLPAPDFAAAVMIEDACQTALEVDPLSASKVDPRIMAVRVVPVVHRRAPRTTPRAVRSAGGGVRGRYLWAHRVNPGDGGPGEGVRRLRGS
ncbi:hypothetical protein ACFB49_32830 [Sphingomonas sp. DBB INV C78]|uniref:transposase n=1 Tax=Sphingomonas sp. DBB INV C78 TaxID=3349434 RepID=UPI0036D2A25F